MDSTHETLQAILAELREIHALLNVQASEPLVLRVQEMREVAQRDQQPQPPVKG